MKRLLAIACIALATGCTGETVVIGEGLGDPDRDTGADQADETDDAGDAGTCEVLCATHPGCAPC